MVDMIKKNSITKKEKSGIMLIKSQLSPSLVLLLFILLFTTFVILLPSTLAAVSLSIISNNNILLGQNSAQLLVKSDAPFNGSINLMSSSNLHLNQDSIYFAESEFVLESEKHLFQKSMAFDAVAPGDYLIIASLMNYSSLNYTSILTEMKIGRVVQSIDISPPRIIYASPTGIVNSTNITLRIISDENSSCKGTFDEEHLSYETFEIMLVGNAETHTYNTTLSEGNYIFYVKCRDFYNNTMPTAYALNMIDDATHS